ncbi:MAG: hypothetical protein H6Q13_3410 [Bacteroidetes bacterium]|jgi:hypothetical protein|nr:hypothetical protein [Bacteroidota bacterium]
MEKIKFKMATVAMSLILTFTLYSCGCSCYLEKNITNAEALKPQIATLIESAKDSIQLHQTEINVVNNSIDEAIAYNLTRTRCKAQKKQWNLLKNGFTGTYDVFLSDWKKYSVQPEIMINKFIKDINIILDNIIKNENLLKANKQKCNQ